MKNKHINMYWYRGQELNIGDELTKYIVEHHFPIEVIKDYLDSCNAIGVGSILGWVWGEYGLARKKENQKIHILGSGFMTSKVDITYDQRVVIHAVRGELSKAIIENAGYTCENIGDLGLLSSSLYSGNFEKKYEVSIIPHYSQIANNEFKIKGFNVIDVRTDDFQKVLQEIAQSELIISQSLHGLIMADSLNVPNIWYRNKPVHIGDDFKFKDYFSSVGRSMYAYTDNVLDRNNYYKINNRFHDVEIAKKNVREWLFSSLGKILSE